MILLTESDTATVLDSSTIEMGLVQTHMLSALLIEYANIILETLQPRHQENKEETEEVTGSTQQTWRLECVNGLPVQAAIKLRTEASSSLGVGAQLLHTSILMTAPQGAPHDCQLSPPRRHMPTIRAVGKACGTRQAFVRPPSPPKCASNYLKPAHSLCCHRIHSRAELKGLTSKAAEHKAQLHC